MKYKYGDSFDEERMDRAQAKRVRKALNKEYWLKWTRLGINPEVNPRTMRVRWVEAPIPEGAW